MIKKRATEPMCDAVQRSIDSKVKAIDSRHIPVEFKVELLNDIALLMAAKDVLYFSINDKTLYE